VSRRKLATAKRLSATTVLFHFLVRDRPSETTRDFQTTLIDVFVPSAAEMVSEYHTACSSSVASVTAGRDWSASVVAPCSGLVRLFYSASSIPSPSPHRLSVFCWPPSFLFSVDWQVCCFSRIVVVLSSLCMDILARPGIVIPISYALSCRS